jgi:hypothetical protein
VNHPNEIAVRVIHGCLQLVTTPSLAAYDFDAELAGYLKSAVIRASVSNNYLRDALVFKFCNTLRNMLLFVKSWNDSANRNARH